MAKRLQTQSSLHEIVVDMPEDFPVILADEARLEHVISNLISNAIKYSPKGEIRISGQIRPDVVIVCVSDQGPGIAVEDIPHVFDRFYRAPDMARNTRGAGLGLFLTRIHCRSTRWPDLGQPRIGQRCAYLFLPSTNNRSTSSKIVSGIIFPT